MVFIFLPKEMVETRKTLCAFNDKTYQTMNLT
jgi:hypothetical protein